MPVVGTNLVLPVVPPCMSTLAVYRLILEYTAVFPVSKFGTSSSAACREAEHRTEQAAQDATAGFIGCLV